MATWVICCGMLRSGSTLQYQITKSLIENSGVGKGLGYYQSEDLINALRLHSNENKVYIVKNHHPFYPPKEFDQEEFKLIYSFRDIRDVIVSLMNKNQKSFKETYDFRFYEKLKIQHFEYLKMSNIYVSKYEDFFENIYHEIMGIADFLKLSPRAEYVKELANNLSMDNQLEKIEKSPTVKKYNQEYSNETLLHRNHIYSGKTDQWKEALTNYQVALIERDWMDYLITHNYQLNRSIYNNTIILKLAEKYRK